MIRFPLPDWVQPVPLSDVETATARMTELLVAAQERGRVGRGELESAAGQLVEDAVDQGIWLLALARPPGRPAALLSAVGFPAPARLDRHSAVELTSYLTDRGGPGVAGVESVPLAWDDRAVLAHRSDASGAQAQALLTDADGGTCYLLTLAGQEADRGPELLAVLRELVAAAVVDDGS
ncbi:MAG TPA: hypothetical protein VGD67_06860 [Pseudonocardiaceae bacterium]